MSLPQAQESSCVCRMLRTKTYFTQYTDQDGNDHDWSSGESTTAVYWCLATMSNSGPDDGFAHPSQCHAPRACYRGEFE